MKKADWLILLTFLFFPVCILGFLSCLVWRTFKFGWIAAKNLTDWMTG